MEMAITDNIIHQKALPRLILERPFDEIRIAPTINKIIPKYCDRIKTSPKNIPAKIRINNGERKNKGITLDTSSIFTALK